MIRNLTSENINKMIVVPGIITSTGKTSVRARRAFFTCTNCGHEKEVEVPLGISVVRAPGICDMQKAPGMDKSNCGIGSYVMNTDKCDFVDQQILKLQEAPELIPTGEMPRTVMLTCDRQLTDKCTPGNRVKVVGILTITKAQTNNADTSSRGGVRNHVQRSYIKVLGI